MDISKYLNIITSQHRLKPLFIQWLKDCANLSGDLIDSTNEIIPGFDVDIAVGSQLDTIGELVGALRKLNFQPVNGGTAVLEDDTYRLYIQSKALNNQWSGTIESFFYMWNESFPLVKLRVDDTQDMQFVVVFLDVIRFPPIIIEMTLNGYIIPKPLGVNIAYQLTVDTPVLTLKENIYSQSVARNTKLGVWRLGNTAFATPEVEVKIK